MPSITCQCGQSFSEHLINGAPRTRCPFCHRSLAEAEAAQLPAPDFPADVVDAVIVERDSRQPNMVMCCLSCGAMVDWTVGVCWLCHRRLFADDSTAHGEDVQLRVTRRRRRIYTWIAVIGSTILSLAAGGVAFFLICIDSMMGRSTMREAVITGELTMFACFATLMAVLLLPLYWPTGGSSPNS